MLSNFREAYLNCVFNNLCVNFKYHLSICICWASECPGFW